MFAAPRRERTDSCQNLSNAESFHRTLALVSTTARSRHRLKRTPQPEDLCLSLIIGNAVLNARYVKPNNANSVALQSIIFMYHAICYRILVKNRFHFSVVYLLFHRAIYS